MAVAHFLMFNGNGQPVKCLTGKKAEKAQIDIQKMNGYSMRQVLKEQCPFCMPKKQESGQDQITEVKTAQAAEPARDGQCHVCRGTRFKLKFINRTMVRECRDCNVLFDLSKLTTYTEV